MRRGRTQEHPHQKKRAKKENGIFNWKIRGQNPCKAGQEVSFATNIGVCVLFKQSRECVIGFSNTLVMETTKLPSECHFVTA